MAGLQVHTDAEAWAASQRCMAVPESRELIPSCFWRWSRSSLRVRASRERWDVGCGRPIEGRPAWMRAS